MSQIDWRTYSDDDVLAEAVEIALELAEAAEEQVMTGIIVPDIEGWPAPGRPLRLELQVKSFLRAAADSLEWGARAMGVRFSENRDVLSSLPRRNERTPRMARRT